ncbi:MAG: hypothetical protein SPLUMA1_SPLUMAMAG1_01416 [uncultured Sulfurimonas sp.]|nr:MAG: hypothetical protein SPLUMA1_SPLUMAMAG1_01416 [uncultured Sulfurimonas sp.]
MRVLIIRCGALGDLVYATSVIEALRMQFGDEISIDFVCTPGSATLFNGDTRVNHVYLLKHKKIPLFFSSQKKAIVSQSKKEPYDILINFEFGKQFKSLVENVIARKKVGALVEDIFIPTQVNRGEAQKEFFKSVVSEKNIKKSFPSVVSLDFSDIEKKFSLKMPYIVLAPSNSHVNRSRLNYRAWQNDKWKELIAKLDKEIQVVIVGAKGEEKFFQALQPYPSNVINLVAKNSIIELNTVLNYANAVVCTDSAVGHLSAALNTPVFVLMGPNDTLVDAPYSSPSNSVNIISLQLECSPCYKTPLMKKCLDNICMNNISVEQIYLEIKSANLL